MSSTPFDKLRGNGYRLHVIGNNVAALTPTLPRWGRESWNKPEQVTAKGPNPGDG